MVEHGLTSLLQLSLHCRGSSVPNLCRNVKDRVVAVCREQGVKGEAFISSRVTQTYDCGACVYFYYGFLYTGLKVGAVSVVCCVATWGAESVASQSNSTLESQSQNHSQKRRML